jgi:ATP-binding cassette subfamily F protein 3
VQDLSGGEKGRLALAKLIYSRVNVLVLDEPTNHLDIPSREALEEALAAYEGTIITISHDRYFLDRVATQILALDGTGAAEHYDGDYTEYHDWKAARLQSGDRATERSQQAIDSGNKNPQPGLVVNEEKPVADNEKRKQKTAAARPGIKVIKKKKSPEPRAQEMIEVEIAAAEKKLSEVTERMAHPEATRDANRLLALTNEYRQTELRLRELYEEWERPSTETASA